MHAQQIRFQFRNDSVRIRLQNWMLIQPQHHGVISHPSTQTDAASYLLDGTLATDAADASEAHGRPSSSNLSSEALEWTLLTLHVSSLRVDDNQKRTSEKQHGFP